MSNKLKTFATKGANHFKNLQSHIKSVTSNEDVKQSIKKSVSIWYGVRGLVTILLIIYAMSMITSHWTTTSEQEKESLDFANRLLFGHEGVVMLIFYMWLFTFIFLAALPVLSSVFKASFLDQATAVISKAL